MLTARLGSEIIRAGSNLKEKDFVYRCLDKHCDSPVMELVLGRGLRIPHFRHKRRGQCSCSDGETEWHREWKSHFDQIERDMGIDSVTGEHNRADAVVGDNFVVEFQHSPISDEEQKNRERFYGGNKGMVWIVDANKKRLLKRLDEASKMHGFASMKERPFNGIYFKVHFPNEIFPREWLDRPVGVIFDYGQDRDLIYLLPVHESSVCVCRFYKRQELIDALKTKSKQFMQSATQIEKEYRTNEELKRAEEEKARRKAEEEKQKAALELRRKIGEAIYQAQQEQQTKAPNILCLHPVEGTSLYVDATGRLYNKVNGHFVPLVADRPVSIPQYPMQRYRWRM